MLSVSLREFQLHPSKYLDKLPIVLTRYGKKVCWMDSTASKEKTVSVSTADDVKPVAKKIAVEKGFKVCQHGSPIGLCKYGCRK